jgi:ATP-dependent exoDNAse (exonuclease V) alpha subunit
MRDQSLPTERELWLKVGAQVMFVVNDPKGQWVNGTLGVITEMKKRSLTVQIF